MGDWKNLKQGEEYNHRVADTTLYHTITGYGAKQSMAVTELIRRLSEKTYQTSVPPLIEKGTLLFIEKNGEQHLCVSN